LDSALSVNMGPIMWSLCGYWSGRCYMTEAPCNVTRHALNGFDRRKMTKNLCILTALGFQTSKAENILYIPIDTKCGAKIRNFRVFVQKCVSFSYVVSEVTLIFESFLPPMLHSAKRGIAIVTRPSVRLSVRP